MRTGPLNDVYTFTWPGIAIIGGYRTPAGNDAEGGALSSEHMRGDAVDLIPRNGSGIPWNSWVWAKFNEACLYGNFNFYESWQQSAGTHSHCDVRTWNW